MVYQNYIYGAVGTLILILVVGIGWQSHAKNKAVKEAQRYKARYEQVKQVNIDLNQTIQEQQNEIRRQHELASIVMERRDNHRKAVERVNNELDKLFKERYECADNPIPGPLLEWMRGHTSNKGN